MSLKLISAEIERFLSSTNPEVICITGKWGVGKTYAWRSLLRQRQQEGKIGLPRYAYVSLFGRNSLDDVRSAIVEGTVDSQEIELTPSLSSLMSNVKQLSKRSGRLMPWAGLIPGSANVVGSVSRALFMLTSEQIVCIDDLERAGSALDIKNILGLASNLRDEKRCKIVILTNKDAFSPENQKVFQEQIEKVADLTLEFAPSSKEAADLALSGRESFHLMLSEDVQALHIVNVRTIKKAEAFCRQAVDIVLVLDSRLIQQAVHTIALATYAKLQPGEAPSLSLIKSFNSLSSYMIAQNSKEEDPEENHKTALRVYEFTNADEFDLELIAGIERGFFDKEKLLIAAKKIQKALQLNDQDNSFQQAWDMLRDSFDDNEDDVLKALHAGILSNYEAISPMSLSSTISLLKEFGREQDAKSALAFYVDARQEKPSFWNLPSQPFGNRVTDTDVRAAFAEKLGAVATSPDPVVILTKVSERSGWSPEDIEFLATLTVSDLVKIFKEQKGRSLRYMIEGCLKFKQIAGADAAMRTLADTAENALLQIAGESAINRRRVSGYITLPNVTSLPAIPKDSGF